MKLPLDIYQLLGVAHRTEPSQVLRVLQKRIDHCKYQGFTDSLLSDRKSILIELSKLLLDQEKRNAYEHKYTESNEITEVEIERKMQLAGILLLLEAGLYKESLQIMSEYEDQQIQLDGCNVRFDYELLRRYCIDEYTKELENQRFFNNSAQIIEKELEREWCKREGIETDKILLLHLKNLLPFRILDLLSRDTGDQTRLAGINYLQELVDERGGLDSTKEDTMKIDDFHCFIRQIRLYLTVQEQLSIFGKWRERGSQAAAFLTSTALVASGFTQRKPERIEEGLKILLEIRDKGLSQIYANIYLLLGDVDQALWLYQQYAEEYIKEWARSQSDSTLGQLCAWCCVWLENYVLYGYKDIEFECDLDEYFKDQDVTNYIEIRDNGKKTASVALHHNNKPPGAGFMRGENHKTIGYNSWANRNNRLSAIRDYSKLGREGIVPINGSLSTLDTIKRWWQVYKFIIIGILMTCTTFILVLLSKTNTELNHFTLIERSANKQIKGKAEEKTIHKSNASNLLETEPVGSDFSKVLQRWLSVKSVALQTNKTPPEARLYAMESLVKSLENEIYENKRLGVALQVNVKVDDIDIIARNMNDARIKANLVYEDRLVDSQHKTIKMTPKHKFAREYRLVKNGETWLVME